MDTLRGAFDSTPPEGNDQDWDASDEEVVRELPPEAIGQDERRMQVRAYNHWASLLGSNSFPSIEDLEPENLPDFGPNSVVLDFSGGIEDPVVQYLGDKLAEECGADGVINTLADVPPRSLLSRITDHYMQILANQAPIGFEAEFVNQRGITIMYRGILLPFSSNDETIDFIYGVINWKEMADQLTADELLLEIDQALETDEEPDEDEPQKHPADPVTEWADSPTAEEVMSEAEEAAIPEGEAAFGDEPEGDDETGEDHGGDTALVDEDGLPLPDFGQYALDDPDEDEDEDVAGYDFASLTDYVEAPIKKAQALDVDEAELADAAREHGEFDCSGIEDGVADDPVFDDDEPVVADNDTEDEVDGNDEDVIELTDAEAIEAPLDLGEFEAEDDVAEETVENDLVADEAVADEEPVEEEPLELSAELVEDAAPVADEIDDEEPLELDSELAEDAGLYDFLAAAREMAQTARASEDRSRQALYAAVGRAYDFSLAAKAEPEEFEDLVYDSGLTIQDRAPMTPVVKLVFGSEYDKTRLTEYAAVLSHAHRLELERGSLAKFLGEAEGGLKGVVQAERRLRREEAGKTVEPTDGPREALAKKLRELEAMMFEAIEAEGPEFALVMVRRSEENGVEVLGEIEQDVPLIERAARKLVG